jgi:hypothetical protein
MLITVHPSVITEGCQNITAVEFRAADSLVTRQKPK